MTDEGFEAAKQQLDSSSGLRKAVDDQVKGGLLKRMGISTPPPAGGAGGGLESIDTPGALEAIVQRSGRPPLLIRNNAVVLNTGVDDSLDDFPAGTDALIKGTEADIPSVGRIEFLNFRLKWGGTGWVLKTSGSDRIIVTNRHVASLVAKRTIDGGGVFLRDPGSLSRYGASIDFNEEDKALPELARAFDVAEILYIAPTTAPDVALMRISPKAAQQLPSPIPLADKPAVEGDLVALIGYPAFDDRNNLLVMARYFRDLYNVKRYAPGKILQTQSAKVVLSHDCTSLGGNSGSPLIRLKDGHVVGLHYWGDYGKENRAVGVDTLRAILNGERPASVTVAAENQESVSDGKHNPTDLKDREGYDPTFIGKGKLKAPWPGLPAAVKADLAKPSDEDPAQPFEIRYTHFGVRFSTSRRQPTMTAVNIDGAHRISIKREDDKWFHDLRIPREIQLDKKDYADRDIDRGHMVRREDPNWDPAVPVGNPDEVVTELAKRANFDTFHYTNSAVQHHSFNAGHAKWLGLEDYILNSAKTHGFKACVFSGPVMRDDDEVDPIGDGVVAPREFWKLVVMEDADQGKLHATAYLLSQGDLIHDLLVKRAKNEATEGFVLGEYQTYQISIADLAAGTGYDFKAYVKADGLVKATGGQEAIDAGEPLFVALDTVDQIIL